MTCGRRRKDTGERALQRPIETNAARLKLISIQEAAKGVGAYDPSGKEGSFRLRGRNKPSTAWRPRCCQGLVGTDSVRLSKERRASR